MPETFSRSLLISYYGLRKKSEADEDLDGLCYGSLSCLSCFGTVALLKCDFTFCLFILGLFKTERFLVVHCFCDSPQAF